MISIKNTILVAVIASLLLSSSIVTLQNTGKIGIFDKGFGDDGRTKWRDSSPYIHEVSNDENLSKGYYRASARYGLEPGKYTVNVKPAGENITLYLKDGEKTIEKSFNESISFETDIDTNTVWIGIIIKDPLIFQEHEGERFEVELVKEDEGFNLPLMLMWGLTGLGVIYLGVYLGIDTYRKKFD